MKMANHTRDMITFQLEMQATSSQVRAIAARPELLISLTIAPKDQAIQDQLTSLMGDITRASEATSTIQEKGDRESEAIKLVGATQTQIELEEGEIEEPEGEEVVLLQGFAPPSHLDLTAPSDKRVNTPGANERLRTVASDMAKAFLFHQEKHNKAQSITLSFFMATSRKVERSFAVVKCFLEKNSETRISILDAFWKRFWQPSFSTQSSRKLASDPKTEATDREKLKSLLKRANAATQAQTKKKAKLTVPTLPLLK